ncbi:MAG: Rpn family recombination-promoting nuclease/putative transposase [Flammeovirgaceae bacterium]
MNLQDKYINPFTDFGFKKLFGTEPNKEFLIDFLNQILPPKHKIADLSYISNEHLGNTTVDRKAIFDLYCTSQSGDRFIVEIQKAKQNYFKDRSVYYSTFPIQEQAKKGDWNFQLAAVYTVGILDFVFAEDKSENEVLHIVQLKDQNGNTFYDKLTYIYLEMPNFNKKEDELENDFDKWLYVFKHLHQLTAIPTRLQSKIFNNFFKAAEIANFSKDERYEYEASLKYYRDLKNVTDTAREEGREEGREDEKYLIAKKALARGLSIQMVSELTGLSIQKVEALSSEK